MRALCIDDDVVVLGVHKKILEAGGFDVTIVENGFDGFKELEDSSYHVIVCDHTMPDLDGESFYEQLEHAFPNLASRVVFVTGRAGDPAIGLFLQRTGQPVLSKPVLAEELIKVVKEIASRPM